MCAEWFLAHFDVVDMSIGVTRGIARQPSDAVAHIDVNKHLLLQQRPQRLLIEGWVPFGVRLGTHVDKILNTERPQFLLVVCRRLCRQLLKCLVPVSYGVDGRHALNNTDFIVNNVTFSEFSL